MQHITLRNFGPIREISIPIKKYNIFIGNSGTGKSTLAKVICNAQWLEKELFVSKKKEAAIEDNPLWYLDQLSSYHNLDNYFHNDTFIEYRGEFLTFTYNAQMGERPFTYTINRDFHSFKRLKTLYIPAERNMVAAVPNWFDIKLPENNLRGFLSAWQESRMTYTAEKPLTISPFNAQYFTTKDGADYISFSDGSSLALPSVASGLQSAVPLLALIAYFSDRKLLRKISSIVDRQNLSTIVDFIESHRDEPGMQQLTALGLHSDGSWNIEGEKAEYYRTQFDNLITFRGTRFFVEEPELNLFPQLQYELLDDVIKVINSLEHNALTITTHSPYILAFLSNYIYADYLQNKKEIDVTDLVPAKLMINQESVSAYYLSDGTALNILSEDPSLGIDIKELDAISDEIGSVWDHLLKRDLAQ